MTISDLQTVSLTALIAEFAESAIRQADLRDHAEHENQNDLDMVNREIEWGWSVGREIARRGRDDQLKLLDLFQHPHLQVKLNACMTAWDVAPVECRAMLEAIAQVPDMPIRAYAGMHLLYKNRQSE